MMKTEDLIQKLSKEPPRQNKFFNAKGFQRSVIALAIVVIGGLLISVYPARSDLLKELSSPTYIFLIASVLAMFFGAIISIDRYLNFGTLASKKKRGVIGWTGGFFLAASFAHSLTNLSQGEAFQPRSIDVYCSTIALMISIAPLALLSGLIFKTPKRRGLAPFFVATSISIGALAINLHCPVSSMGHHFLGHALAPMVGSFILSFMAIEFCEKALSSKLGKARAGS